jgi:hypothetical protein
MTTTSPRRPPPAVLRATSPFHPPRAVVVAAVVVVTAARRIVAIVAIVVATLDRRSIRFARPRPAARATLTQRTRARLKITAASTRVLDPSLSLTRE